MIPAMARKKPPKKKASHGGRRPGAGRKPLPEGHTSVVSVTLPAEHIAKVVRWQDARDCESFSDALRQMIDTASP